MSWVIYLVGVFLFCVLMVCLYLLHKSKSNSDSHSDSKCKPNCKNKKCGDDGCGGNCAPGCIKNQETCGEDGKCHKCIPNCENKYCGSDGCGGICPPGCSTGTGDICDDNGKCKCGCEGLECGKNKCGTDCGKCGNVTDICRANKCIACIKENETCEKSSDCCQSTVNPLYCSDDSKICTKCKPGNVGLMCQYNDKDTCSGHGSAQSDGSCKCDKDYTDDLDGKKCAAKQTYLVNPLL